MTSELPVPTQLTFDAQGMTFHAQAWGDPSHPPLLALHGWLDNSASFYRLAPLLSDHYVVALDLAGHGFSDHRPTVEPYNIWQDIGEITAIADQLGWQRFALIGHSRGAIISMLLAGTFPDRISHLVLLDGFIPQPVAAHKAPEQLAQSILENQSLRPTTRVKDRESLIRARMLGRLWPLTRTAATAIVDRGSVEVEGGYRWRSDPRLHTASAVKYSQEQIDAFLQRIQAVCLLLVAEEGTLSRFAEGLPPVPNGELIRLPGSHHFHMEDQVEVIAGILKSFLG